MRISRPAIAGQQRSIPSATIARAEVPQNFVENSVAAAADAILTVSLPADAKIFVNDNATRATGTERHFVSPELLPGRTYIYQVRAELTRNGKTETMQQTVELSAGDQQAIEFAFDQQPTIASR